VSRLNNASRRALLCYVTDRRHLAANDSPEARETLLRKIGTAAQAGVEWIQIREKDLSGQDCSSLTREALQRVAKSSPRKAAPTRILVNDRLDIALSQRAGGVHLGENSLPLTEVKRLLENRANGKISSLVFPVILSKRRKQLRAAARIIFFLARSLSRQSKAAFGAPQGLERLAEVCRGVSIPVLAIGGVTLENAPDCLAADASGIAAIRLFQDARDLFSLVQSLQELTR